MILERQAELREAKHVPGLQFKCGRCGQVKDAGGHGCATGYGYFNGDDRPVCYECCAEHDRKSMVETGKAVLYLTCPQQRVCGLPARQEPAKVSNWPGSLSFPVAYVRVGRHNVAGKRYDIRFTGPDGKPWVGVVYGDNTQICHCRRVSG
jgi:hypothetical protein